MRPGFLTGYEPSHLDRRRAFRGDGEAPLLGDHCEDDLGSVHPRPGELARVDLPDNHAEAVPRDKDFIDPVELRFARLSGF